MEGGGVCRDFQTLAGGGGWFSGGQGELAEGHHLLDQPIPHRVVRILDDGPVVILHLDQPVQIVVGVLRGGGKRMGGQKENEKY